ncbi:TPA: MFS transporter [Escherichia coli]
MVTINTESALTPRSLRDTRRMNMFVSVAAAVAGLLFGLDIGVIAGALPFITDHFVLTSRLQEWVVSSMMLGAAIGALFNGWLSFRLGRKYSLMAGAILFVLGSIGSAFATSVEMLIAAPVVWILCSEIQPLKCRDFGITCSTTTNWVSNMIIGATFLTLLDSIGAAGTFWLYTALNIAFVGITFWLIPETKNVTLEHIERKLMAGEKLRNIGV